VIRATQKLLPKLGTPVVDPPPSTTVLGDWYAKPFGVAQRRFVLLISEKSRLAVVMPGRDVATLPKRFPEAMGMQLALLGVPQAAYEREMEECRDVVLAKTASKSLLGTLNDYAYMVHHRLSTKSDDDLDAAAFSLSHTPLSPLGYKYASEVALSLFGIESKRSRWPF
jgi:hypothetical protein